MLVALLLLPLLAAFLTYLMANRTARVFTVLVSFLELGMVFSALHHHVPEFEVPWIPALGISMALKLTGLNILMLILCPLLAGCAALATSERTDRLSEYCGHLLLLLAALQGVFLADNLGLFYIFFELMLLPTLMLVSRWGPAPGKTTVGRAAAVKFLLYTLAGSLPMLLAVVALAFQGPTPDLSFETLASLPRDTQISLFGLFFLAFAVKIPLFPLHGWVVDLYESCPTSVTALVAGAMSKAGLYGLLRICVGLLPEATRLYADNLAWLAFFSLVYGAVCALGAPRLRAILAFSSLSHLGLMTMGILAANPTGRDGVLLQMLSHGLCTGGLFLVLAFMERRGLTLELSKLGGLHQRYPRLTALALVLTMSALGCPGLSSYPGELGVILGVFQVSGVRGTLCCFSVIMSAWYMLRFFQGALQGPAPAAEQGETVTADLSGSEMLSLAPIILFLFAMGFAPQLFLQWVRVI